MSNDPISNGAVSDHASSIETKLAEAQRDMATYVAEIEHEKRREAEVDRDTSLTIASEQAAQRDALAVDAATEAFRRQQAENRELDARIVANQAASAADGLASERNMLREDLAAERESASNANFGVILLTCLLLAAVLGFGIYSFFSQNNTNSNPNSVNAANNASPTVQPTTVAQPPAPQPTGLGAPATNVNINVQPTPPATVNVTVPSGGAPISSPSTGSTLPDQGAAARDHRSISSPGPTVPASGTTTGTPNGTPESNGNPVTDGGSSAETGATPGGNTQGTGGRTTDSGAP